MPLSSPAPFAAATTAPVRGHLAAPKALQAKVVDEPALAQALGRSLHRRRARRLNVAQHNLKPA